MIAKIFRLFCPLRSKLFPDRFWGAEKGRKRPKSNFFGLLGCIWGAFSAFSALFQGGKKILSFVAQHVRVETFLGFDFAKNAR